MSGQLRIIQPQYDTQTKRFLHDLSNTVASLDGSADTVSNLHQASPLPNESRDIGKMITDISKELANQIPEDSSDTVTVKKSFLEDLCDRLDTQSNLVSSLHSAYKKLYQSVSDLYNGAEKLVKQFHNFVSFIFKGEEKNPEIARHNLPLILEKLKNQFKDNGSNFQINCARDLYLDTDETLFYRVMHNLYKNAQEHLSLNPDIKQVVTVSAKQENGLTIITVSNPGSISTEQVTSFNTGGSITSNKNSSRVSPYHESGLGLQSASEICKRLGGHLSLECDNNQVSFKVTLS